MKYFAFYLTALCVLCFSCLACINQHNYEKTESLTLDDSVKNRSPFRFMTLDPGHFHAFLIHKSMYEQVDSVVYVYATPGREVDAHLEMINQYNTRETEPTSWKQEVYTGDDYLEKMILEKPGDVMMVAGNNAKKTQYIHQAVNAGINVLADKPMVIKPKDYPLLKDAFEIAKEKGVLIYDIMTERYEITTVLQKLLSGNIHVFGEMEKGSPEDPAISKESVHHFYKYVSGKPLKRPPWFFDVEQEGAGIVDVSTHLVDLILWECFPEEAITEDDVRVVKAKQWATALSSSQFEQVTGFNYYPTYLENYIDSDKVLRVNSNGEFIFTVRGIHGKVSVIWNFEAPEGAKDTHYSIMRGSRANLVIRQDQKQQYIPTLYIEPTDISDRKQYEILLRQTIQDLKNEYPGLSLKQATAGWELVIPDRYRIGHEAHFRQVTEKYLQYLEDGKLPEWEVTNMLTKYFVTMNAYKKSLE